eukprot:COSAG02_NODE_32745_length_511_cov_1.002427_1_plen_99_part_10
MSSASSHKLSEVRDSRVERQHRRAAVPAALPIVSCTAHPIADENLNPRVKKAVGKKQDEVTKRLKALHPKLNADQLAELRKVEDTWTLIKSADGLGMNI